MADSKIFTHALNCTLTATSRTMCCILENYQTLEGIVVQEVLRNYLGGNVLFFKWNKCLNKINLIK